MKKKIILMVIGSIFAIFSILSFNLPMKITGDITVKNIRVMAQAKASELCPNGCLLEGKGCMCYGWHPKYKEYDWTKPQMQL